MLFYQCNVKLSLGQSVHNSTTSTVTFIFDSIQVTQGYKLYTTLSHFSIVLRWPYMWYRPLDLVVLFVLSIVIINGYAQRTPVPMWWCTRWPPGVTMERCRSESDLVISWFVMTCHDISWWMTWNITKYHHMWWNVTKYHHMFHFECYHQDAML